MLMPNGQLVQMVRRLRRRLTGPGGDATDQELLEPLRRGPR